MAGRPWGKKRTVGAPGLAGEPVQVVSGLTRDRDGRRVVALGIFSRDVAGPAAVLTQELAGRILANLRLTHGDLVSEQRRGDSL